MLNPKKKLLLFSVLLPQIGMTRDETHTFYLNLTITGGGTEDIWDAREFNEGVRHTMNRHCFLFCSRVQIKTISKLDGLTPTREFGCANCESSDRKRWLHEPFITCKNLCWLFQQFCLHGLWFNIHSRGSWVNVTSKVLNLQITWYITFVAA